MTASLVSSRKASCAIQRAAFESIFDISRAIVMACLFKT